MDWDLEKTIWIEIVWNLKSPPEVMMGCLFIFQMARMKLMLRVGKRRIASCLNEIERWRRQLGWLVAVGVSPDSSPMREPVQRAVEAGTKERQTRPNPSNSSGGEAGHMRPTTSGKPLCKESPKVGLKCPIGFSWGWQLSRRYAGMKRALSCSSTSILSHMWYAKSSRDRGSVASTFKFMPPQHYKRPENTTWETSLRTATCVLYTPIM